MRFSGLKNGGFRAYRTIEEWRRARNLAQIVLQANREGHSPGYGLCRFLFAADFTLVKSVHILARSHSAPPSLYHRFVGSQQDRIRCKSLPSIAMFI